MSTYYSDANHEWIESLCDNMAQFDKYFVKTIKLVAIQFIFMLCAVLLTTSSNIIISHLIEFASLYVIGGFIGGLAIIIYMALTRQMNEMNLTLFTLCQSYILCSWVALNLNEILYATIITFVGIIIGLIIFAITISNRYNVCVSAIYSNIVIIFSMSVLNILMYSPISRVYELYCGAIVVFHCIILSVHMFLTNHVEMFILQSDLHVIAAINIYTDIPYAFIQIISYIINCGKKK
jgi:hypothetical protein